MGGKQSYSKASKNKSSISKKRSSCEQEPSQELQRSPRRSNSNKSKEKEKRSISVPPSFKRIGGLFLEKSGLVRRAKSWAIEV